MFEALAARAAGCAPADTLLVFSVGGGNLEKNVSPNLVRGAAVCAKRSAPRSLGIVGRDGGYTAQVADACVDRADRQCRRTPRRMPRRSRRWSGTCWSRTPR